MNSTNKSAQPRHPIEKKEKLSLGWTALDWLFPPSCVSCQAPGFELCPDCRKQIKPVTGRLCPTCGVPHLTYGNCHFCQEKPPAFDAMRSWAIYEGVIKDMIHALKYKNRLSIALPLGQYLANFFETLHWEIDLIVPVAISPKRQRARGYNQSTAIARVFQRHTGLPLKTNALGRIKHTRSQVGLGVEERLQNVEAVFWASTSRIKGKRILVIDDVCTSSATMRSCAASLKSAGAIKVYGLTVARAGFYHQQQFTLVDDLPAM
jgi:ComF family protein